MNYARVKDGNGFMEHFIPCDPAKYRCPSFGIYIGEFPRETAAFHHYFRNSSSFNGCFFTLTKHGGRKPLLLNMFISLSHSPDSAVICMLRSYGNSKKLLRALWAFPAYRE